MEILFTLFLFILDQGSKFLIESFLKSPMILIPNFFSLNLVYNTGASFSILENQTYLLIGIAIFCLVALQFTKPTISNSKLKFFTYAFLYAGILGNLVDRLAFHYVRDFLEFHIFGYSFPIFNFADIYIVIGTFFMIYMIWKEEEGHGKNYRRFRRKTKN